jgi:hypothetical protein
LHADIRGDFLAGGIAAAVQKSYGADLTPAWLDHVRLSTIRRSEKRYGTAARRLSMLPGIP